MIYIAVSQSKLLAIQPAASLQYERMAIFLSVAARLWCRITMQDEGNRKRLEGYCVMQELRVGWLMSDRRTRWLIRMRPKVVAVRPLELHQSIGSLVSIATQRFYCAYAQQSLRDRFGTIE
jgi:hypothetical protein